MGAAEGIQKVLVIIAEPVGEVFVAGVVFVDTSIEEFDEVGVPFVLLSEHEFLFVSGSRFSVRSESGKGWVAVMHRERLDGRREGRGNADCGLRISECGETLNFESGGV